MKNEDLEVKRKYWEDKFKAEEEKCRLLKDKLQKMFLELKKFQKVLKELLDE